MVGLQFSVPDDVSVRYEQAYPWIGCNRIFCDRCSSWIRRFDGYRIAAARPDRAGHEALYALDDPARSPLLFAEPTRHRTYVCRCSWDDTPNVKMLSAAISDDWHCAG